MVPDDVNDELTGVTFDPLVVVGAPAEETSVGVDIDTVLVLPAHAPYIKWAYLWTKLKIAKWIYLLKKDICRRHSL